MNKKKTIIAAIVLLLVLLVGGAIAYFTDTDTKTNTFTVGKVNITLTEPAWVPANGQEIVPGQKIAKDPTITVENDSKDAYLFMEVTIPAGTVKGVADTELFTLLDSEGNVGVNSGWVQVSKTGHTYVYAYGTASAMTPVSKNGTATLFNKVEFAKDLTETEGAALTGDQNVVINAYAIQADGLDVTAPDAVWQLVK